MFEKISNFLIQQFNTAIVEKIEIFGPKVAYALLLMLIGFFISYAIFKAVMYVFKKFKIVELIDKTWENLEGDTTNIGKVKKAAKPETDVDEVSEVKVQYDSITAKAFSYYIFLLFFRSAIEQLGVTEVEKFMSDLINYLPSLFVGILIGFFGLRFANSVHDIIYHALNLAKNKTAKIIAMAGKIIIMFFTLMIMLHYIQIVDEFIINSLFIGFISTLTLAFGLSFGLGGRDLAKEILNGFKK